MDESALLSPEFHGFYRFLPSDLLVTMLAVDPFAREVIMTRPGFLETVVKANSYEILDAYVRMYPKEEVKRSHAEMAIRHGYMHSLRWFLGTQEYDVPQLQKLCREALLWHNYVAVDMIVATCPTKYSGTIVIPDNVDVSIATSVHILEKYKILVSGPKTKDEAVQTLNLDIMMRITPPRERDLFMVRALRQGRTDLAEQLYVRDGRVSQKWDLTSLDRSSLAESTREYMRTRFHQFGPSEQRETPTVTDFVPDPRVYRLGG